MRALLPALLLVSIAVPARAQVSVPGVPEADAVFGFVLVYGDFDGDGDDDLAVSAPSVEGTGLGYVTVLYLTADGRAATGARRIVQGVGGVPGIDEPGDLFGWSLAAGDFDGDGRDDLAIGAPGESIGTVRNAGAVFVLYGSDDGLTGDRAYSTAQDRSAIPGVAEEGDFFGYSLAAGDAGEITGSGPSPSSDGYDELVIGVPFEDIGTVEDVGAALVLYGAAGGLSDDRHEAIVPTSTTASLSFGYSVGVAESISVSVGDGGRVVSHVIVGASGDGSGPGAVFGYLSGREGAFTQITSDRDDGLGENVAVGDFDGDGVNDFAFGRPYASAGGFPEVGAVDVYLSTRTDALTVTQSALGAFDNEAGDSFGRAIAAGDLDEDGYDDLVVGARYEGIGAVQNAGAAFVFYGSSSGPTGDRLLALAQDQPGIPGVPETSDAFGYAVAASAGRLAIGVPGEDIGDIENAGAALALVATADGVTTNGLLEIVPGADLPGLPPTPTDGAPEHALSLTAAPNPASGAASARLTLAAPAEVRATVFDALGRRAAVLHDGPLAPGDHAFAIDAGALPPGLYLVHVRTEAGVVTRPLTVVR